MRWSPTIRWLARSQSRVLFLPARRLPRWLLAARADQLLLGRRYLGPPEYRLARWLFLRLLGGTFFIAFTSLGRQVLGLYGSRGISPMRELMESERLQDMGPERFRLIPSVFWLGASDKALVRGCRAGQVLSLALMFNVAPRFSTGLLWGLYLSYVSAGREFLSFQWDALLLEMGLLGVLTAPPGLRPGPGREAPSAVEVALFRALVFRLYVGSGVSKLKSGDRTWRELTACTHYYETAPLPTRGGWYAHQLPLRLQKVSTAATLVMETAVPFLVFAPRRLRQLAFLLFGRSRWGSGCWMTRRSRECCPSCPRSRPAPRRCGVRWWGARPRRPSSCSEHSSCRAASSSHDGDLHSWSDWRHGLVRSAQ
jgi:hypothetical protein